MMVGFSSCLLVFGHPDLSTWASYLILLMEFVVFGILIRRNIAPAVLAKLSRHLRARSISMRSIRGLYIRSKDRTWRIERISWSISVRSQKHISIKVTGLSLELTPPSIRIKRHGGSRHYPNPVLQLVKVFQNPIKIFSAMLSARQAQKLRHLMGSICRKVLVMLVQTLNFELDTVIISCSSFPGMELAIGSITFNSTIDFLSPPKTFNSLIQRGKSRKRFSMATAREVFTGRTDVAISLAINISKVIGKNAMVSSQDFYGSSGMEDENSVLYVPGIVHTKLDFSYDLLTRGLSPDTFIASIHLSQCDVFLDRIIPLFSSGLRSDPLSPPLAVTKTVRERNIQNKKLTALKAINIQIEHVNLIHHNTFNKVHQLTIKSLDCALGPSDGSTSLLHRDWLGSKDRGFTLGLILRVDQIQLGRRSPVIAETLQPFLIINRIDFDSIFHKWPLDWTFLPNRQDAIYDPLVIWKLYLGEFRITDQFRFFIADLDVSEEDQLSRAETSHSTIMPPHFQCELHCDVITMNIYDGERVSSPDLLCSLTTSDINIHVDLTPNIGSRVTPLINSRNQYTFLAINLYLLSGPVYLNACLKDNSLRDLASHGPLVTMDGISGYITGYIATCHNTSIDSLTLYFEDSIIHLKVLSDNILLNVWRQDDIILFHSLMQMFSSSKNKTHKTTSLPFNYSLHIGIHHVSLALTGLDINPNCDLPLSRGLEFDSICSLRIVSLSHLTENSTALGLDEEILKIMHTENYGSSKLLFLSCTVWKFACSAITAANNCEYGRNKCLCGGNTLCPLLYIPSLSLNVFPSDHSVAITVTNSDTTIQGHIDLLGVYSILLVHRLLQKCSHESEKDTDKTSLSMEIRFKIHVHGLNVRCHLPLSQDIFLRAEGILINRSSICPLSVSAISLEGYVPNRKEQEEWDQMLTLSQPTLQIYRDIETDKRFGLTVHGFRFSIPHEFIFSGLLVNLTIAFKALRHLQVIVQRDYHIPFPSPTAETPKVLPNIDIHIRCLVIEAMDNPLDGKIGRISRIGLPAQRLRLERERAFKAKVRNLRMETEIESDEVLQEEYPYKFTSKRTVSISDAWDRLNQVHALSWSKAISREEKKVYLLEESVTKALAQTPVNSRDLPIVVPIPAKIPPLFRAMFNGLDLRISPSKEGTQYNLPSELGNMSKLAQYTLFVPFHMKCVLAGARICVRDYPLPLFNLPITTKKSGLEVETDVVIAEELGPSESVEWYACPIIPEEFDNAGRRGYQLDVPKTIMPVKSYADLKVKLYSAVTEFTWGASYSPVIQDILRIIETLTPVSPDPSPPIGFWDKLRLVLHWRMTATFNGTACLHFKGSHDPYQISGLATGFDFRWNQNVVLRVNHENPERELIQLVSDTMVIMIPCSRSLFNLNNTLQDDISAQWDPSINWCLDKYEKLCAEFCHGIRWGIGFVLERTCNSASCHSCHGDPFSRTCRFFTFSPHHEVALRKLKISNHDLVDSYYGFRSNFIHLSTSLTSPLKQHSHNSESAFHLTPKTFTHFWSWWSLFDDGISLPIRQGRIFPEFRLPTQKFSQHLATVKYRIEFSSIYIAHVYKLETAEDWKEGKTRCIGIKTLLDSFQADLHQRLEQKIPSKSQEADIKVVRHRPFYAVDVIFTGLDLRSLMATFVDPNKQLADLDANTNLNKFLDGFTPCSPSSEWIDLDDFKETDWEMPDTEPTVYLHQTAFSPRLVYFKRVSPNFTSKSNIVKFGDEATHVCLMGKEPSVQEIQLQFGIKRLLDLRSQISACETFVGTDGSKGTSIRQMINLLEEYVQHSSATLNRAPQHSNTYMPANIVLPEEIQHFVNVYQVHCPVIHFNNATRDILHEYYAASRARRGFEYHLSARAVKFIRDQELEFSDEDPSSHRTRSGSASIAAKAVKRILVRENRDDRSEECDNSLMGWEPGISERKAHLCLLLKPQVVLQSDRFKDSTLLLAADHVVLRNHGVVDDANIDDPVSGHIMRRNFANINGLQLFQPFNPTLTTHIPFEVFLDIRCESSEFKRIVPHTHATLRYDSFNKLRLRNNVTTLTSTLKQVTMDHLLYEMDLLLVDVPRFSVAADASTFAALSSIVNDLLLFSDPARKARSLQLETMIFGYDFTNYQSAAKVVSDLQSRLRWRLLLDEFYRTQWKHTPISTRDILENKAYIFRLSEELNMIFDAFKLAQIKTDDRSHDKKSALRLHTSSSEVSWRMLGNNRELLAKLAVRGIGFSWLRRQDSSTTSALQVEDLQAFDGSPNTLWPEVLTKYNEPLNHHMIKQGLFMKGQWSVLAPVGGISIYSDFKIELHPIRLTLETQLGNKILAYILPGRRSESEDHEIIGLGPDGDTIILDDESPFAPSSSQSTRCLLTSRSLSNLNQIQSELDYHAPGLPKSRSSAALVGVRSGTPGIENHTSDTINAVRDEDGDVYQMRYRSNQKTFVHAEIPSVHMLLSIVKNGGFLIRDARLRTHDLEWRNRTSSMEELVEHFVPSNTSWRGWVKVAWQQPVFSVGNVVKELVTKTQWGRIGKRPEEKKKPNRT